MRRITISLLLTLMATASVSGVFAQSPTGAGGELPASPAAKPADVDLNNVQKQIFRDYERFEKSLYDVAEQMRRKDPEQAEVLYRARSKSQEDNLLADMELIAELLRSGDGKNGKKSAQYGPAVDRQEELLVRMESILKLLKSLDERQRLADEMKQIQELLKDTNRIIAGQKDVRAETLRGRKSDQLKDSQEKVAKKAEDLADKIDRRDAEKKEENANGDQNSEGKKSEETDQQEGDSEQKPSDGEQKPSESGDEKKPGEGEPKESKSGEQQPKDGQKPQEGEQSESGEKPEQGEQSEQSQESQQGQQSQQGQKPQQGQQKKQQQQSEQRQEEKTPGREQLEEARKQMQKAIEDLLNEKNDDAVKDQDAAVARLEELKAQLEEILRQLRQEEKESYLTLLEARFQNMLRRQLQVNSETKRLDEIPQESRAQQGYSSKTNEMRKEQEDNLLDAGKALNLLREEGSSVAFPEAIEQMQKNMRVVVNRLGTQDTGKTTQLVETLVVETLEEMIEAFQQELKKQEEQKQQQGKPQQQGQPQDPALVDQIAELKMIRSLQLQINRITQQLGTEIDNPAHVNSDQQGLIDDIAQRQKRIQEATYDLSVGRNK